MSGRNTPRSTGSGPIAPLSRSIATASSALARFGRPPFGVHPVATCQRYAGEVLVRSANSALRAGSLMKVNRSMADRFSHGLNIIVNPTAKQVALAGGYAPRMDVFDIRTENLRLVVHEITKRRPGRLQKDLAGDLGLSPSYLSQLMTGKKMGEDVARKIESSRHLAHGWMDHRQAVPAVKDPHAIYGSHSMRIDPDTIAAALQLVRLSFLNLGLEIDQEENGGPLALAYDFLSERQERNVNVDNLLEFKPRLQRLMGGKGCHSGRNRNWSGSQGR